MGFYYKGNEYDLGTFKGRKALGDVNEKCFYDELDKRNVDYKIHKEQKDYTTMRDRLYGDVFIGNWDRNVDVKGFSISLESIKSLARGWFAITNNGNDFTMVSVKVLSDLVYSDNIKISTLSSGAKGVKLDTIRELKESISLDEYLKQESLIAS